MTAPTNVLQRLTDLQAAVSGPTLSSTRNSEGHGHGHGDLSSLQSLQSELDEIDSSSSSSKLKTGVIPSSVNPPKKRNDSSSSTDSIDPYSESPEYISESSGRRDDAGKSNSDEEEDEFLEQEKRLRRYSASLASHTANMFETYYQTTSQEGERAACVEPASSSSAHKSSRGNSKTKTERASVDDAQSASRETNLASSVMEDGTLRASA